MTKSGILRAGTRALGYDIITLCGKGQFGEVYEVYDTSVGRRSALKLIEVTDPAKHRAVVEAQAQYLCSHNNIVQILTADEISAGLKNYVAIEMEFIEEGSLEDHLQSNFVSVKESIFHIKQILFALEHAHNNGIVHRDVKPGNILLASPRTKLSDFGVVICPASGTEVIDLFYVPHAPPEALNAKQFSHLCDIYAAGITLLRVANNIQDWTACLARLGNWRDVAAKGLLVQKIGFEQHIPRALRVILNRACNADPTKRFQSAAAFRGALEGLKIANDWKRISENEWLSLKGSRAERIELQIGAKFNAVYKINDRRNNSLCKTCKTEKEARSYMMDLIYKSTLG